MARFGRNNGRLNEMWIREIVSTINYSCSFGFLCLTRVLLKLSNYCGIIKFNDGCKSNGQEQGAINLSKIYFDDVLVKSRTPPNCITLKSHPITRG